jgi:hypothetical protein
MPLSIIYPQANGSVAHVTPTGELPLEDVALKDVPAGTPYLIVDTEADLPPDFDFFEAWEADFSNSDGTGIGADAWFAAHPPVERRPGPPEGYVPEPIPEPETQP